MTTKTKKPGRRFATRKGQSVISELTDDEAAQICANTDNDFARKLASMRYRSVEQLAWLHILAVEAINPKQRPGPPAAAEGLDVTAIKKVFDTAKEHLRRPKIRLQTSDGRSVNFSLAGPRSKNAGCIYVAGANDAYFGKITPDGRYLSTGVPQTAIDLVKEFAADPVGTAASYGKLTGSCCFCGLTLTDARSTSVGYGPVCASHFGLPWGDVYVEVNGIDPTDDDDDVYVNNLTDEE